MGAEMSGLELITQLRVRRPDIKNPILSGYQDDMKLTPHERFLQKPFSSTQLLETVRAAKKMHWYRLLLLSCGDWR